LGKLFDLLRLLVCGEPDVCCYLIVTIGNNDLEWWRVFLQLSISTMKWNPLRVSLTFGKNVV